MAVSSPVLFDPTFAPKKRGEAAEVITLPYCGGNVWSGTNAHPAGEVAVARPREPEPSVEILRYEGGEE